MKINGWQYTIVKPVGGHAVFLDAKAFLPHIPQSQYQLKPSSVFVDSGVGLWKRGNVSAGRDKDGNGIPKLELVHDHSKKVYTYAQWFCSES